MSDALPAVVARHTPGPTFHLAAQDPETPLGCFHRYYGSVAPGKFDGTVGNPAVGRDDAFEAATVEVAARLFGACNCLTFCSSLHGRVRWFPRGILDDASPENVSEAPEKVEGQFPVGDEPGDQVLPLVMRFFAMASVFSRLGRDPATADYLNKLVMELKALDKNGNLTLSTAAALLSEARKGHQPPPGDGAGKTATPPGTYVRFVETYLNHLVAARLAGV